MKSKDQYISLYNYRGIAHRGTKEGQRVYETAKEKNIRVIYENLPENKVTGEYTQVATYPRSFLDEYFGQTTVEVETETSTETTTETSAADAIINGFRTLMTRITTLETRVEELTKKLETNVTNSNEPIDDDDDLPF